MTGGERRLVCAVLVCIVGLAVFGGVSGGDVAGQVEEAGNDTGAETDRHERPGSAAGSGDLEAVQRWLGDRLLERLVASTLALEDSEYERARAGLDEPYGDRLAQYADVAEQRRASEGSADSYRRVAAEQRNLTALVASFEATDGRYREARASGSHIAARQAAHRLDQLADRVERRSENLTREYERLSARTGADTSRARATVQRIAGNVSEREAAVRTVTLVETDLVDVSATPGTVSYADPLSVTGRLVTANGTALADRNVTVRINDRPRSLETDASGRFTASYRPRTLAVDAASVRVAYAPRPDSNYLGTNATVPVDVEQVRPAVSVRDVVAETGFGRPAGATVIATVDGRRVRSVPVTVSVGDHLIGRARTNDTGAVRVASTLPPGVSAGEHRLTVTAGADGLAIGPVTRSRSVRVVQTPTNLTLAGRAGTERAAVEGRLVTADGRPVSGQTVSVDVAGRPVRTVETDETGEYSAELPRESLPETGPVTVRAAFVGDGTSLRGETATSRVTLAAGGGDEQSSAGPGNRLALLGSLLAVLVLSVAGLRYAWSRPDTDEERPEPDPKPVVDTERIESVSTLEKFAAGARNAFDDGSHYRAVQTLYAGVRRHVAPDDGISRTHREVLRASGGDLDAETSTTLYRLTELYERVVFGGDDVDAAELAELLGRVQSWAEE